MYVELKKETAHIVHNAKVSIGAKKTGRTGLDEKLPDSCKRRIHQTFSGGQI